MIHKRNQFLKTSILLFILLSFLSLCCHKSDKKSKSPPMAQFPSPMVEDVRAHERIADTVIRGISITLDSILAKPVEIFIPGNVEESNFSSLFIHFHGSSNVPKYAVTQLDHPQVLAVINLGAGSSVYEKPFKDAHVFNFLIDEIHHSVTEEGVDLGMFSKIVITSFSAGYGAVRAILRHHQSKISGNDLIGRPALRLCP